ncbi:PPOX class F420-dependent oxidoreductase [Nocardia sp. alder85J]|uniref:PPOX class F420-dependent oxidoreductase n=1 Tax=Nocardia sp. alder85J TaxID=2862949 RepID=UPI001CD4FF22|nr:PPOX class F420-dependent oxidoreductase [Nocardia sp. alder85J]MCX4097970.1 PPOX class F420-dependent oxidoreductase [Nocardia sp. alder85J]
MPNPPADLTRTRYALLRSFRRDGTAVDTPIWFRIDGSTVLFRTKIGPKTRRLAASPRVELRPCDYRGRVTGDPVAVTGQATILTGPDAEAGNRALHQRYGWQWNVVPMLRIPGVVAVHRDLSPIEKLRRIRTTSLWADSAIVRVELDGAA